MTGYISRCNQRESYAGFDTAGSFDSDGFNMSR